MKKIALLTALLSIIFLGIPCPCAAEPIPKISARSACLYDMDADSFIINKEMNTRLPMASTTKIMTALLAIELCELDATVTIPRGPCTDFWYRLCGTRAGNTEKYY